MQLIFSTHKRVAALIAVIIVVTVSCKKYPEDGKTTLRTPINRLAGKWTLAEFRYDNKVLTDLYTNNGLTCQFEFLKDDDKQNNASLVVTCPNCYEKKYLTQPISNSLPPLYCNFEFEQKKKSLRLYGPSIADSLVRDTGAFLLLPKVDWVIRKLTTSELKLEVSLNDKVSTLIFTK